MLRVQRTGNGGVVFTLSGRLEAGNLCELSAVLGAEPAGKPVALDLNDLVLVDEDAIRLLLDCERNGIALRHCPRYIAAWMALQGRRR
jgi:hypothetical protein